jgi:hypothetical protein
MLRSSAIGRIESCSRGLRRWGMGRPVTFPRTVSNPSQTLIFKYDFRIVVYIQAHLLCKVREFLTVKKKLR